MTMTTEPVTEINETLEFEKSLKQAMAAVPEMSLARLLCAEMIGLCMSYRELLENRLVRNEGSNYGYE